MLTIRPSGEQIVQCSNTSRNDGVSYSYTFIYTYIHYLTLFNPLQSAYRKFHSTETVFLSLHDHLIHAVGQQHVTCLCLLDLSAAFDTIDHTILLECSSQWFGVHGTVLTWFRSYLSDRSFCVKCSGELSQPHHSCYSVPRGSVLGPLLFSLYTTPLRSLISSFGLNHHLYADDTQLFISFQAT